MQPFRVQIGPMRFTARWEEEKAPNTARALHGILPFRNKIVHCRWTGESCWVPLGDFRLGVEFENQTSHPAPGELLFYPGGISECEILVPYGAAMFSSKVGQLAGNHFATIVEGREQLAGMGPMVLWQGAQDFVMEEI